MISAFLSVSLLVAFLVGAVDATTLRVQEGSPTCSGQFELTSFAYDCGDECTPGVGVEIAGSIYSSNGFAQKTSLTVKACFMMGMFCWTLLEQDIDICDRLEAQDDYDDDAEGGCPEPGNYSFSSHVTIPGNVNHSYWHGYTTKIHAIFKADSSTSTDCSLKIEAQDSSEAYQAAIGTSIVALALLGAYKIRSRRQIAVSSEPLADVEMTKASTTSGVVV